MTKDKIRWIIRGLSVLLIIGFFIPCFLVSCGYGDAGVKYYISEGSAAFGIFEDGEWIAPPLPWTLIFMFSPIAIIVLSFIKQITERIYGYITTGLSVLKFILLLVLCGVVKAKALSEGCDFKVQFGFVFNLIMIILLFIVSGYGLFMTFNTKAGEIIGAKVDQAVGKVGSIANAAVQQAKQPAPAPNAQAAPASQAAAPDQPAPVVTPAAPEQPASQAAPVQEAPAQEAAGWFCPKCGQKNGADFAFCTKCGNPKPQI